MIYKLLANGGVRRLADGAWIPPDLGNADWRGYQAFLAGGGVPDPADPLPGPDNGVGVLQSRRDALREQIDDQIGSLSEDQQSVLRNILKLIDKEV